MLGPFTIFGLTEFNTFAKFLAIKVFPHPGGPYKSTPFACLIPYFFNVEGGNLLDANALLNILASSSSKPPIPRSSNLKLESIIDFF